MKWILLCWWIGQAHACVEELMGTNLNQPLHQLVHHHQCTEQQSLSDCALYRDYTTSLPLPCRSCWKEFVESQPRPRCATECLEERCYPCYRTHAYPSLHLLTSCSPSGGEAADDYAQEEPLSEEPLSEEPLSEEEGGTWEEGTDDEDTGEAAQGEWEEAPSEWEDTGEAAVEDVVHAEDHRT